MTNQDAGPVLYKDPSLPVAERAANLLSRMTLSGKVAQLVQFTPEHQAAARRVSFTLGPQELSYCGPGGKCVLEPGEFRVWAGGDSTAELSGNFHVASSRGIVAQLSR